MPIMTSCSLAVLSPFVSNSSGGRSSRSHPPLLAAMAHNDSDDNDGTIDTNDSKDKNGATKGGSKRKAAMVHQAPGESYEEFVRRRNAMYQRDSYHRRLDKLVSLEKQVEACQAERQQIMAEYERLSACFQQAQEIVRRAEAGEGPLHEEPYAQEPYGREQQQASSSSMLASTSFTTADASDSLSTFVWD